MNTPNISLRDYVTEDSIYNPKSLAIRITYQCNISCKFCYNNSTADSKTNLSEEQVIEIIEKAREEGFETMGISGGEALMYRDVVLAAVRRAKELGYKGVGIVSNGFWAKTKTSAKKLLMALKKAGFQPPKDMFSMSAGEFHHEWLDWKYAKNAISEYHRIFKHPLSIDFETTPGNENLMDEFKEHVAKEGITEKQYILRERKIVANLGRWKDLDEGIIRQKPIDAFGKCGAINRFSIQPDGDVVPCCGFNRYNTGIILGNVLNSSIPEVITAAQENLANKYLTHVPMNVIYKELSKEFTMPDKFSVICELCELIFSKKEYMDYLEGKFEELSKPQ